MNRYFILYRWFEGGCWHVYNHGPEGMTRKQMKKIVEELKEDSDMEIKVVTESIFKLFRK